MQEEPSAAEAEQLAQEHPEAVTLMAATDVARVLAGKGYEVTVRPVSLLFNPDATEPELACDIIFVNPVTKLATGSVLTLRAYPEMLASARRMVSARGARLVVPMGPNGGLRA